ncbi:SGNH/GDSL hydrolase family protein [Petrimonas sp.]|jgi:lysophospholipase L1-like esterase|uniref:SGNH/GDSL hydrolase family protein n=1 Tax=Petrimonas TaxID=307628 RepID=UPI000E995620|nr:SGNH/GDSL hydrolase family protein [Petrimonas sp.]HBC37249.1 acylhydrolase [Porphyromonadaceae bacterium]MDD4015181.1 SGNH/GDSL hydrolase family protein [Petrimonas sp.]MDX9776777.1 SGNH/GDSL hydrolase family protein [Petrimonas sp.]MEA4996730.1 SGNH/GDSL hydrolase family protein [Petrimonas sp.]
MKTTTKLFFTAIITLSFISSADAQDWANLTRFKEDNAKIGMPRTCDDRVVFMGNSITQGWIEKVPKFFENRPYINRGISGQTTPQMLVRFRQDVINLYPKVVVILAGTNDIAGNTGPSTLEMIEDNIHSMTELAQSNGIQVVLCSVLPAFDYKWKPGLEPAGKIVELNRRIKKYAETHGAVYCDYFSAMADERNGLPESLSGDGVHPNPEGYALMAPIAETAIARALLMWKDSPKRKY